MLQRASRFIPLLLLPALTAVSAPLVAQQPLPGYEQGIFELSSHGVPPTTLLCLVDSSGRVLLPVRALLQATGLQPAGGDSVLLVPRTDGSQTRLELAARRLVEDGDTILLPDGDLVLASGEIFLAAGPIGRLLQADVTVDMGTLGVRLVRTVPFPIEQAAAIAARRRVLEAAARYREQEALRASTPYRPVSGLGVLDWNLTSNGLDPRRGMFLSSRLGAAVWGGALVGSGMFRTGGSLTTQLSDEEISYHRVFPRSSWIRQATFGDLVTDGVVARPVRGLSFSNLPEERGTETGQATVRPELPDGWEYEVFQSGRLVGYSDAGGGGIPVQLQTGGVTPVYVRMYGPAGQEVTQQLIYHAPVSLLPRGRVEYAVGGGSCRDAGCRSFGYGDLRYGLLSGLTLGAGMQRIADTTRAVLHPGAELSFTTGRLLAGELSAVPGQLLRGSLSAHRAQQTMAQLSAELARPGFGSLLPFADATRQWNVSQVFDQHLARRLALGLQSIRLRSSFSGTEGNGLQLWSVATAATLDGGYAELQYENGRLSPGLVSLRTTLLLPIRGLPRLGALTNELIAANEHGFQILEAGLSVRPRRDATITLGTRWTRQEARPAVSLGFTAVVGGGVQTTARITSSRYASAAATLGLSGAAAIDPQGDIDLSPLGHVGYGGVHGIVFRDLDGDGRFGPGDEPVPGANVLAGNARAVTDASGRYRAWSLKPYNVAAIAVDTLSMTDPSWTAERPAYPIRPVPNSALRVDIPLVQTHELSGTVVAGSDVATAAGLTVQIRNTETGETLTTSTFSDGEFYVSRIRPGDYILTVAASSLQALRASPSPVSLAFSVPHATDVLLVELPTITLHAAPR